MKKNMVLLVLALVFIIVSNVYAAQNLNIQRAMRVTRFNNFTDYVAAIGKSTQEKKKIRQERQESRKVYRLNKERRKDRIQTQKRIKREQQNILNKVGRGSTTIGL